MDAAPKESAFHHAPFRDKSGAEMCVAAGHVAANLSANQANQPLGVETILKHDATLDHAGVEIQRGCRSFHSLLRGIHDSTCNTIQIKLNLYPVKQH